MTIEQWNSWRSAKLPYVDGGGYSNGYGPTSSAMEFYCTPFDDLIWNRPYTA